MKESLSCFDLHHSLYMAPDQLRTCCKRFFVDGEMKGDVVLMNLAEGEQPTPEQIHAKKKELYDKINAGEKTACSGCPWLTKDQWPAMDSMKLKLISVEAHSVCNLKCTYCSDTYYGGKQPNYSVSKLYDDMKASGALDTITSIAWGGGEPVIGKDFATNLVKFTQDLKPSYNKVFSNSILYSAPLAKLLAEGSVSLTTSIDAGTPQTYKKIRGADHLYKVLGNLQRYVREGAQDVTIKYILTDENSNIEELDAYFELVKKYDLFSCAFQISSDFKHEEVTDEAAYSAMALYLKLFKAGARHVFFDDHLRPRINEYASKNIKYLREKFGNDLIDPSQFSKIVVWGAGQYSARMIASSFFFSKVEVDFFVDKDQQKIGREFFGKQVKPIDAIKDTDAKIFIGASSAYAEICKEIQSMGVDSTRILTGLVF